MIKLITLLFLFLFLGTKVEATPFKDESEFSQLKQYISLNENKKAWEFLLSLEDNHLGDTDFDFLYGLVALRVNEKERAVYAFERVIANKPNWLDAQYYLAISYFEMKNYHAALEITNKLLATNSTSQQLKNSTTKLKQHSLTLLDKQSLYLYQSSGVNLGYDSNINAGTSEENIFLPLLDENISLSKSSRKNSDSYLSADYQLRGVKAITQTSRITFSGSGQLHYFINDSDYNRILVNSNVEYQKDFSDFSTTIGARVTPLWLNDSFYRTQFGATFGLTKAIFSHWIISANTYIGKTKNDVNERLNTDDKSIQTSVSYSKKSWLHSLSFNYSQETSEFTESQQNNRKVNTISYSTNWAVDQKWLISSTLSYQNQAYQYEHPYYFEKRNDDMWFLASSVQYQESSNWLYRLSANIQDKDSNLSLFSYQRADISLSARLSF